MSNQPYVQILYENVKTIEKNFINAAVVIGAVSTCNSAKSAYCIRLKIVMVYSNVGCFNSEASFY